MEPTVPLPCICGLLFPLRVADPEKFKVEQATREGHTLQCAKGMLQKAKEEAKLLAQR